jgi:hypothetical protein
MGREQFVYKLMTESRKRYHSHEKDHYFGRQFAEELNGVGFRSEALNPGVNPELLAAQARVAFVTLKLPALTNGKRTTAQGEFELARERHIEQFGNHSTYYLVPQGIVLRNPRFFTDVIEGFSARGCPTIVRLASAPTDKFKQNYGDFNEYYPNSSSPTQKHLAWALKKLAEAEVQATLQTIL